MFQGNHAFFHDQVSFDGGEHLVKVVSSPKKIPSPLDNWGGESLTPDDEMSNNCGAQLMPGRAHPSDEDRDVNAVVSVEIAVLPDRID